MALVLCGQLEVIGYPTCKPAKVGYTHRPWSLGDQAEGFVHYLQTGGFPERVRSFLTQPTDIYWVLSVSTLC